MRLTLKESYFSLSSVTKDSRSNLSWFKRIQDHIWKLWTR